MDWKHPVTKSENETVCASWNQKNTRWLHVFISECTFKQNKCYRCTYYMVCMCTVGTFWEMFSWAAEFLRWFIGFKSDKVFLFSAHSTFLVLFDCSVNTMQPWPQTNILKWTQCAVHHGLPVGICWHVDSFHHTCSPEQHSLRSELECCKSLLSSANLWFSHTK